ncbi:extracellular solute-binding protein [Occultella kanbiaonis]|uniref:extracellular solute-binding protein n=1 Tax=Occultella kanbiaonis TaxID=2675754 RepID=UPI0012B7066F|nr:extracellular solute-binding protein [Occultella kanbiaonis]
MTLRRRDFLAASGVSISALALAACSGGGSGGGGNGGGGGGGEISILTPEFAGTTGKAAFEGGILDGFFEGSDFTYKVDYTDWTKLNEKLSTSVAGGLVADMIMPGAGWVEPFAHKGVLTELPESLLDGLPVNENLLAQCRYEGTLHALPFFVDGRICIYNRAMFDAAGIADIPTNLDDLREALKEVTPDGGVGIDLFSSNIRQTWSHLLGCFGGRLFNDDGTEVTFTDGTGVAALQYMLDLVADGTANFDVKGAEGQPRPWQQGQAAVDLLNSSLWPSFTEQSPDLVTEDAMGMFLLPSAETGGDPVMWTGGTLLTMSSRSANPEKVQELMSYMLEAGPLLTAVTESGKVPARTDIDDPVVTDNLMAQYTIDNFDYATAFEGGSPAWMEIRGLVAPELEAAVTGQKTAQQAIDALAAASQDALSRV